MFAAKSCAGITNWRHHGDYDTPEEATAAAIEEAQSRAHHYLGNMVMAVIQSEAQAALPVIDKDTYRLNNTYTIVAIFRQGSREF